MTHPRRVIQLRSYALAFAVALSPAFFQISYSCERGNTFILSLEVEVSGQDQIANFSVTNRSYAIAIDSSTAVLRVVTQDPASNATYRWFAGGTAIGPAFPIGVGGGQVTVTVPDGQSQLYVNVQAPEGAFDSYVVDVERTDPVPAADIPMYCHYANFFGAGTQYVPTEFELTVDPLGPVSGGASFDAEISGFARTSDLLFSAFSSALGGSSRIAVWDGATTVLPRSGAAGPSVVLQLAPLPTTCAYDANGRIDIGAGPFPSCNPANNTGAPNSAGSFANTDCIGLGGMPSPGNPCLPFRNYSVIEGSGDGCAQCASLGVAYESLCLNSGFCTYLSDPNFPLTSVTATFDADFSASALFGFDAGGFSPPYVPALGDGLSIAVGGGGSAPGALVFELNECYMGEASGPNLDIATPLPDSALVSIPVELTPYPCTEQGILDAIAAGGGPHTFDCVGPTTVNTTATIVIDNDVILDGEGNLRLDAGGTHAVLSTAVGSVVSLSGITVTGGAGGFVGGIHAQGDLTLIDVVLTGNTGDTSAIFVNALQAAVSLVDCVLSNNTATAGPAGFQATVEGSGSLTLLRTTIADNTGFVGVAWNGGTLQLTDSALSNNTDDGVEILGEGQLQITSSTILAASGVFSLSGGAGQIEDSLLMGTIQGGGGELRITNSTVDGGAGQAIVRQVGSLLLNNVTAVGDVLGPATGGASVLSLRGNVVVGVCFAAPATVAGAHNRFTGSNICGLTDPSNQFNIDPSTLNLGPLQDNGGPTETFLPGPGSVAIDAIPPADCLDADGAPLTTDQRGIARPQGTDCDIGAVEVEQP